MYRQNSIRLEEKEKMENEMLQEIIDQEAERYKVEFYRSKCQPFRTEKDYNWEKEKLFLAEQDKFQVEAEKNYQKTIVELIPHEVAAMEQPNTFFLNEQPQVREINRVFHLVDGELHSVVEMGTDVISHPPYLKAMLKRSST